MRFCGLDIHYQDWIQPYSAQLPKPEHGKAIMNTPEDYEKIVEKNIFHCPSNADSKIIDHAKWEKWSREQAAGNAAIWLDRKSIV